MKTAFRASFAKDIGKLRDGALKQKVRRVIESVEAARSLKDVANLKRLSGDKPYFRLRVGDYRLGLALEGDNLVFVRFLHRREIYRFFP